MSGPAASQHFVLPLKETKVHWYVYFPLCRWHDLLIADSLWSIHSCLISGPIVGSKSIFKLFKQKKSSGGDVQDFKPSWEQDCLIPYTQTHTHTRAVSSPQAFSDDLTLCKYRLNGLADWWQTSSNRHLATFIIVRQMFFLSFFKSIYYLNVSISIMRRPLSKDSPSYCTAPHGSLPPHRWRIGFGSKQPDKNVKIFPQELALLCDGSHRGYTTQLSTWPTPFTRVWDEAIKLALFLYFFISFPLQYHSHQ